MKCAALAVCFTLLAASACTSMPDVRGPLARLKGDTQTDAGPDNTMLSAECGQDWRDAGYRDGRFGTLAWDVQYAAACGSRFDRGRYLSGLEAGTSDRPTIGGM